MTVPTFRTCALVCASFTSILAAAQDLPKRIDYTTHAVSLRHALEDVSAQADVKLYPSDELADEPIILRLKSATTKDFMDRLATTVGATWQDRGKGEFMLVRTEEMHSKLYQEALDARAAKLAAAIKVLSDSQAKDPFDDKQAASMANSFLSLMKLDEQGTPNYKAWDATSSRSPSGRALVRLLAQIDPKALAAIPMSTTTVFSNEPTRKQLAASFDAISIGEKLQQETNMLADAMAKYSKEGDDRKPLRYMVQDPFRRFTTAPTRFIVSATYDFYYMGGLRFTMIGFDSDNHPLALARMTLMLNSGGMEALMSSHTKAVQAAKDDPPAKLSNESLALIKHIRVALRGGDPPPIPDDLREAALNPEAFDPLNFVFADLCLDLSDEKNVNAIFYPSDMEMTASFMAAQDGTAKLSTFEQDLTLLGQGSLDTSDGWMTYTPTNRLEAWQLRTNRSMLGECLRDADEHGFVSIEKAGALAQSERCKGDLPSVSLVEEMFGRVYAPYYQRDKATLRFYASLDDQQRQALTTGTEYSGGLSVGSLSKGQYDLLEDIAYDGMRDWFIRNLKGDPAPSSDIMDFARNEAVREPTEVFPNGLPASGSIHLDSSQGPTYFATYKSQSGSNFCINSDLRTIAYYEACYELYGNQPNSAVGTTMELQYICSGQSRSLNFHFNFNEGYGKSRSLQEASQTGNERWTLSTLPSDIRDQIMSMIEENKKEFPKMFGTGETPAVKPPEQK